MADNQPSIDNIWKVNFTELWLSSTYLAKVDHTQEILLRSIQHSLVNRNSIQSHRDMGNPSNSLRYRDIWNRSHYWSYENLWPEITLPIITCTSSDASRIQVATGQACRVCCFTFVFTRTRTLSFFSTEVAPLQKRGLILLTQRNKRLHKFTLYFCPAKRYSADVLHM